MAEALDPNLRGLIHVLANVLVREIEHERADATKETERKENAPWQARSLGLHFDFEEEMQSDHST